MQKDRHAIFFISWCVNTLQWRHNEHDSVSNHQPHDFYSTVYSDTGQRKHQSSASLAFVRIIHRGPVNSPHKWPVARKMLPFGDVIMMKLFIFLILWFICDWIKGHDRVKRRYNAVQYNTISHTALRWHRTVHNTYKYNVYRINGDRIY